MSSPSSQKPRQKFKPRGFDNFGEPEKKKFRKKNPQPKGMHVMVYDDDVMKAWRILKRKVTNENLMGELRDRRYFMKPSEKRQEKLKEQKRNERRRMMKVCDRYGITWREYDPMKNNNRRSKKRTTRR
jgi:small subunit ribosomal protein S21